MKVTLINTADAGGGAPAACMRLLRALRKKTPEARLLVQEKRTDNEAVVSINNGLIGRLRKNLNFFAERIPFMLFHEADKTVRFAFSTASTGTDISKEQVITQADVLHLHWTNQGFLSIKDLKRLLRLNKPVVWTLHDMWTFTGGCHYAGDCNHFEHHCGHCWMLNSNQAKDLSSYGWKHKNRLYERKDSITFVTCSHWLADMARKSSLLSGFRIETIPNPIDSTVFKPGDKAALRSKWGIGNEKHIILFGAANIMDRRKGLTYLIEALELLKEQHVDADDIAVVIFGKNKAFGTTMLPFKAYELGIISSEKDIAEIYGLADVFVTPAIEDNLPNTVMEAMACGVPVVAFNTGGIPDMIDHQQNGYLAKYKSATDLAAGLNHVLTTADRTQLAQAARQKVLATFNDEVVASKYMAVYQSLLK
ncbi:glycosyltransferase family 4 protein [Mucilaginibacter yixingensis]|nr:glycosyltransferase family 4 protein [Mucilaginibacter yixingensis]